MTKTIQLLLGAALLITGELAVVEAANCAAIALTAIPQCAQTCFLNGAPTIGCGGLDFACQCASEAKLYAAIEGCVATGCPTASYQAVIDGASSVCGCATAGLAVGGSVTVSGISGISVIPGTVAPGTVVPGSFTTTTPISTTTVPTTKGSSSQPTTTAAPVTSATNTPFATSVPTFAPTASVVHAGSARSRISVIGSIVAVLVVAFAWL
ncbi:hypothetical protein BR93DRAFT_975538 [Coniochaeta sp. PMI_546]|nr:hypothetical protein BR93DRAFT_975538 [Coniochaeta sp. PMI_546]